MRTNMSQVPGTPVIPIGPNLTCRSLIAARRNQSVHFKSAVSNMPKASGILGEYTGGANTFAPRRLSHTERQVHLQTGPANTVHCHTIFQVARPHLDHWRSCSNRDISYCSREPPPQAARCRPNAALWKGPSNRSEVMHTLPPR